MFNSYKKGLAVIGASDIPETTNWGDWVIPVPSWDGRLPVISDTFHPIKTDKHRQHLGVDLVLHTKPGEKPTPPMKNYWMGKNVPALSAGPGKVVKASKDSHGHYVIMAHRVAGRSLVTVYRHLQFHMGGVYDGAVLPSAFPLGPIGDDPANSGDPPHLHFDFGWTSNPLSSRSNWAIDPAPYMIHWKVVEMGGTGAPGKRIPVTIKTFAGKWPKVTEFTTKPIAKMTVKQSKPSLIKRVGLPLAGVAAGTGLMLWLARKGNLL